MTVLVYASELACKAAGRSPVGEHQATEIGRCAMCARPHEQGESVAAFNPLTSFTDWASLKAPASTSICRWCKSVWDRSFTQTWLKTVVTPEGIFPAARNDHLAYWMLNPPQGPWLFLQGDQKIQHVVWRAPVNYSPDFYFVRAGESLLSIRRQHLRDGVEAVRALAATATQLRAAKRGAPLKSPFLTLSRDRDAPSQGALRHELLKHAQTDKDTARQVDVVGNLTAGELWALTAVLYAADPHRPDPINTIQESNT